MASRRLRADRPSVLILGSMPSVASLDAQQYYALPRKRILADHGRIVRGAHRIVVPATTRCADGLPDSLVGRAGKLHSSRQSRHINRYFLYFRQTISVYFSAGHPTINRVFFNGKKAAEMYRRYVLPVLDATAADIPVAVLPRRVRRTLRCLSTRSLRPGPLFAMQRAGADRYWFLESPSQT